MNCPNCKQEVEITKTSNEFTNWKCGICKIEGQTYNFTAEEDHIINKEFPYHHPPNMDSDYHE